MRAGSLGVLGGLSAADLLRQRARGEEVVGQAKAVIVLWLWGGPSHIDLFDPKPDAPIEYRGPFDSIATNVSGIRVGELLPRMAKRMDRIAIVRSMNSESNDHGVAGTIGLTGSISGAIDLGGKTAAGSLRPATGSIVGRVRGIQPNRLPPYVILGESLTQGKKRVVGEGAGSLGARFDPFRVAYSSESGAEIPQSNLPTGIDKSRFEARWKLRGALTDASRVQLPGRTAETLDNHYELAHSLVLSGSAKAVLEVKREPTTARERYGWTRFGQSCLIARRLVETGIPFVQVNWSTGVEAPEDDGDGGWDMHDRNFQILQDRHGWIFDQAYSALLDDLHERRLLDSTLVVAVGEFGRSPKINEKAGREHWQQGYSALLAGGGIRGGTIVGATDKRGERPVDRPVTPADLGATILARMGIGSSVLTPLGITPLGQSVDELF